MANSKRSRRRRTVTREEVGDIRVARERQTSAERVIGCLKQRCAELAVTASEAESLIASLTQAFQPMLNSQAADEDVVADESFVNEDSKFSITKQGREFVLKGADADEVKKFTTTTQALAYYQAEFAHQRESTNSLKKIYADFFCNFCLNDSTIDICAFCGCRKCFGKFSVTESSVTCSECKMEYHSFCCSSQGNGAYMCNSCFENNETSESNRIVASPSVVVHTETSEAVSEPAVKKNRVGRPKGSLNKSAELKIQKVTETSGKVVSAESALEILSSSTYTKLLPEEIHILDQMRLWGSKGELVSILYI